MQNMPDASMYVMSVLTHGALYLDPEHRRGMNEVIPKEMCQGKRFMCVSTSFYYG